jgi:hypothetical protein
MPKISGELVDSLPGFVTERVEGLGEVRIKTRLSAAELARFAQSWAAEGAAEPWAREMARRVLLVSTYTDVELPENPLAAYEAAAALGLGEAVVRRVSGSGQFRDAIGGGEGVRIALALERIADAACRALSVDFGGLADAAEFLLYALAGGAGGGKGGGAAQ